MNNALPPFRPARGETERGLPVHVPFKMFPYRCVYCGNSADELTCHAHRRLLKVDPYYSRARA